MNNLFFLGLSAVATATIAWGLQFPIAADVFTKVDPFYITSIRYLIGSSLLFGILLCMNGRSLLQFGSYGYRVNVTGIIGMGFSPVLVFWGISLSTPEQAAIIVATQPTIAILIHWFVFQKKPDSFVLFCVFMAFAGVLLVITKGRLNFIEQKQTLFGNAMTFLGASMWVIYSIETSKWRNWDSVKLTLVTMLPGTLFTVLLTAAIGLLGYAKMPTSEDLMEVGWEILYLSVVGVLLGMLAWNYGNRIIGALNSTLFINLIPVAAFGTRALQGQSYLKEELFGAFLVILALILNNMYARWVVMGHSPSFMRKFLEDRQ